MTAATVPTRRDRRAAPSPDADDRTHLLRRRARTRTTAIATGQIVAAAVFLVPIIWMYVGAFRSNNDLRGGGWLPASFTLENFERLFGLGIVWPAFVNSTLVAATSAIAVTIVSVLAAYGISRYRFRGRAPINAMLLLGQLVPALVVLVPLVVALRQAGLADSIWGLALTHVMLGIPIAVLLLGNYLRDIPIAIEEAATLDGASRLQTLWHIVLPLLRPGIAAVTAFSFILSWGEYLLALSLITSESAKTLPLAMQSLFQRYGVDLGVVMAFGVVISLPVAVLFMFVQRSFVENLGAGSVK